MQIDRLLCEDSRSPLGVDVAQPRFRFVAVSDVRNVRLAYFRIQVGVEPSFGEGLVWDSGMMEGEPSVGIRYGGAALLPHTRYYWRAMAWDREGRASEWSEPTFFETAFVNGAMWEANFIGTDDEGEKEGESPCVLLRRSFHVRKEVASAKVYATAKGMYELRLNGRKVGDDFFAPGYTHYRHTLQYQSYDITGRLTPGDNAVGIILGDGWYKGYVNWKWRRNFFGDKRKALLEIHIRYEDGETETVVSDHQFKWAYAPIRTSEIYHGEVYDAREEHPGYDLPGFDDRGFRPVVVFDDPKDALVAERNECVKAVEIVKPVSIIRTPAGETVLDMGQNMVGILKFRVSGRSGDKVRLKFGEILDRDGNFYFDNIWKSVGPARQEIDYTLKGEGTEEYRPHFTYHGFRYVKIEEFPGVPVADQFEGLALSSFVEQAGRFECSDERVNRLQRNILWTQRGNFIDIPIAGPQRAERVGWTGDAQMFARTACYNMDAKRFYRKWLADLRHDQYPNGAVPWLVPNVTANEDNSSAELGRVDEYPTSAGWGDAALIVPWLLYVHYGDPDILREQYDSMKRYVEFMRQAGDSEDVYETGFHYGDWFSLDAEEGNHFGATPKPFIATAFYAYSASILVKAAGVLGYMDDAERYERLHARIVRAFRAKYVGEDGHIRIRTQTACVIALQFGLLEERHRQQAVNDLVRYIRQHGDHLTTGFLSTPHLCYALSEHGHADLAYRLLLREDYPSWLYQIIRGATTVWEHWDGIRPDGSLWDPWMNSFNHTALGSIGEWLYAGICGIQPDEANPGFKHFFVKPQIGGNLRYAQAELQTAYGTVRVRWEKDENRLKLFVTVPVDAGATVVFPGSPEQIHIGSGDFEFVHKIAE